MRKMNKQLSKRELTKKNIERKTMTQKIELISNYINTDKIVGIKKVKNLSNYDKLLIAKEVVAIMIDAKQNQIQNEPNESIWKEEQSQLYRVLGLMDCEEESWHE